MPEKWTPKQAVLSIRRITMRNVLVRRTHSHYVLGESIDSDSKQPVMDSIWEWNKGAEIRRGKMGGEII